MTAAVDSLEQQTYLPSAATEGLAEVHSFLRAHEAAYGSRPAPRYFLAGAGEGDQVEIPAEVHAVLLQVVAAMTAGKAVTVMPQNTMVTTQQAADILGVSRPTVVKLADEGQLPYDRPGKRRRMIRLDDVLAYRDRRREAQYQALMDTSVSYDEDEDPAQQLESLREVRAQLAARRRADRTR